jgi:hypothetical protein
VLEIAPLLLKRQIIGCLAALVQYRRAAKLFVQWNSQVTMKGAMKILLEFWQSEQEVAGSTTNDGVIRDIDRPLNPIDVGEAGADETIVEGRENADSDSSGAAANLILPVKNLGSTTGASDGGRNGRQDTAAGPNEIGTSITDRQDCRAKIFSILSSIGFECHEALNIAERQQMELAKLFPTCMEQETWIKVQENLAANDLKPVAADRKWIEDSIGERKEKTKWVLSIQQKLADERRSEEHASLHRFYEDIRTRSQFRRSSGKDGPSRLTTPAQDEAGTAPAGMGGTAPGYGNSDF